MCQHRCRLGTEASFFRTKQETNVQDVFRNGNEFNKLALHNRYFYSNSSPFIISFFIFFSNNFYPASLTLEKDNHYLLKCVESFTQRHKKRMFGRYSALNDSRLYLLEGVDMHVQLKPF